jgi:hypothetical protein
LKEETLDRTLWQTGFGWGYGHVVCQTTGWIMHVRMRVKCLYMSMYVCMYNQLLLILSVSAVFVIQHAKRMRHIFVYGLPAPPPFSTLCHK